MQYVCVFVEPDLQLKYFSQSFRVAIPDHSVCATIVFDTHTVWAQRVWGESLLKTGPGMKPNVALGVNVMIFSTETV